MGQAADSVRHSSNASNAPRLIDRFRAANRSRNYQLDAKPSVTPEKAGRQVLENKKTTSSGFRPAPE
jgi:hypothetical protein